MGWPVSVHDNRVWRNCRLKVELYIFFSEVEYLLKDSAYTPESHIVPAFKSKPNSGMTANESRFNQFLSRPRVKSEHCIGLLKGRLPWLKNIRIRIKDRGSQKKVCEYVSSCVVLHNMLVGTHFEEEWIDEDFIPLDEDDELNLSVAPLSGDATDTRRQQLGAYPVHVYFNELKYYLFCFA